MEKEILTASWSEKIEKVIKGIGESCQGYKWMNIFAAKRASKRYNILMYLLIFIGPISGILSALSTVDDSKNTQILVTVFSFISGVISAIIKFSKYEQKSTFHKTMAARYTSLEGNVCRQLSLSRNERINAGEYLQWVSTSFDNLFSSAPMIPDRIYNKWLEFAKENKITIPPKLGGTIEIQIDEEQKDETKELPKRQRERSKIYDSALDLTRYNDSEMQYELRRLRKLGTT